MAMAGRPGSARASALSRHFLTTYLTTYVDTPTLGLVCTIADNRVLAMETDATGKPRGRTPRPREQWAMGTVT